MGRGGGGGCGPRLERQEEALPPYQQAEDGGVVHARPWRDAAPSVSARVRRVEVLQQPAEAAERLEVPAPFGIVLPQELLRVANPLQPCRNITDVRSEQRLKPLVQLRRRCTRCCAQLVDQSPQLEPVLIVERLS